jgi:hypothetical protein
MAYFSTAKMEAENASEMKNAVFWDVAPLRSWVKRRFGERFASIFKVEILLARNQR